MKLSFRRVARLTVFLLFCSFAVSIHASAEGGAFTPSQLFESWGWVSTQRLQIAGAALNQAEIPFFMRGASLAIEGKAAPYDLRKAHFDIEKLARERQKEILLRIKQGNVAKAESFFRDVI